MLIECFSFSSLLTISIWEPCFCFWGFFSFTFPNKVDNIFITIWFVYPHLLVIFRFLVVSKFFRNIIFKRYLFFLSCNGFYLLSSARLFSWFLNYVAYCLLLWTWSSFSSVPCLMACGFFLRAFFWMNTQSYIVLDFYRFSV